MEKGDPYVPAYEKGASLKAYKCSYCNRIYSAQGNILCAGCNNISRTC